MKFTVNVIPESSVGIANGFGCPSMYRFPALPETTIQMCLHWPETVGNKTSEFWPDTRWTKAIRRVGFARRATTTVFTADPCPKSKIRSQFSTGSDT
jgi:hypothetical protein